MPLPPLLRLFGEPSYNRGMKVLASLGLSLGLLALAPPSRAAGEDANGFGEKHQLIVTADRLLPLIGYTHASVSTTANGQDLTDSHSGVNVSLLFGSSFASTSIVDVHTLPRIAFDFTVIKSLTVGGAVAFGAGFAGKESQEAVVGGVKTTTKTDDPTSYAFGFTPRVGYVIPLTEYLAFWPRLGLGIYHTNSHQTRTVANVETETSVGDTILSLDVDPQLVITPYPHVFMHVGPILNAPLSGSRSTDTTAGSRTVSVSNDVSLLRVGLSAGLGGWFNL